MPDFSTLWPKAQEARLIQLLKEGLTYKQIEREMNLSRSKIAGKTKRLKDSGQLKLKKKIKADRCQYMYGDPVKTLPKMCRGEALPEKPYCEKHSKLCYISFKKEKDVYRYIEKRLKKIKDLEGVE